MIRMSDEWMKYEMIKFLVAQSPATLGVRASAEIITIKGYH